MDTRARMRDDAGLTLVEVMAAMVIMVVGVLGTLVLVQGGLSSTDRTTTREQATNLARDLVERSRQANYDTMTYPLAPATLRGMLPASDSASALSGPTSSTFMVTRRKVIYTVDVFACSIDDPTDGIGVGDATSCAAPSSTNVPGSTEPGLAASVNVLGISVAAGGSLLQTVCNSVGTPAILSQITAVVSPVVPLSVCPSGAGTGTIGYDSTPDDLRRVRVRVSWTRGGAGSVTQTTMLTNPKI